MSNTRDFKVKNGIQPTAYHEAVGTVVSGSVGYSLGSAVYDSVSFDTSAQLTSPQCIVFNTDGSKMYVLGFNPSPVLYQYSLSTAFDLSTASYSTKSFSFGGSFQTANRSFMFKPDGTKMYAVGTDGEKISSYSLSTAFDVDTATLDTGTFDITAQTDAPSGMCFNSDGSKVYVTDRANARVHEYDLSTAYDITTMSYSSVFLDVSGQDTTPRGAVFSTDGATMYLIGFLADYVYEYSLSTAFDLSTASYSTKSFSFAGQAPSAFGVAFNLDFTKMYLAGGDEVVYQYSTVLTTAELDLSTGSVFEVTPTSDIQVTLSNPADSGTVSGATLLLDGGSSAGYDLANAEYSDVSFSVASQDTNPFGMAFSNDGTKMYVVGQSTDTIYQYSLSTAFDLNTASYSSVNLSVNSQDPEPSGMAFNSDGTKMYVVGDTNNSLFQYSLSTGFDLSTASYDSVSFSVSGQDITPLDVAFNNDGTKMYVLGNTNDTVFQYSLSTAFDLSTASYDSVSFSVGSQESTPLGITFKSDGTKMYVVGRGVDTVFQYSLSTAFDLSTTSYDSVSFSVGGQDTIPYGVVFSGDGTKMYVIGITNDSIYQYTTATPATITYDTAIEWPSGTAPTSPAIGETDVVTFNTRDGGSTYQGVLAIDGAK